MFRIIHVTTLNFHTRIPARDPIRCSLSRVGAPVHRRIHTRIARSGGNDSQHGNADPARTRCSHRFAIFDDIGNHAWYHRRIVRNTTKDIVLCIPMGNRKIDGHIFAQLSPITVELTIRSLSFADIRDARFRTDHVRQCLIKDSSINLKQFYLNFILNNLWKSYSFLQYHSYNKNKLIWKKQLKKLYKIKTNFLSTCISL